MAQTSVEWLEDFMKKNQYFIGNDLLQAFEQAKEMHKKEIKTAFDYGMNCSADYFEAWSKTTEAENYYNQTFNK
jgi:hypothetical protein